MSQQFAKSKSPLIERLDLGAMAVAADFLVGGSFFTSAMKVSMSSCFASFLNDHDDVACCPPRHGQSISRILPCGARTTGRTEPG
jgi:hypothetical protein